MWLYGPQNDLSIRGLAVGRSLLSYARRRRMFYLFFIVLFIFILFKNKATYNIIEFFLSFFYFRRFLQLVVKWGLWCISSQTSGMSATIYAKLMLPVLSINPLPIIRAQPSLDSLFFARQTEYEKEIHPKRQTNLFWCVVMASTILWLKSTVIQNGQTRWRQNKRIATIARLSSSTNDVQQSKHMNYLGKNRISDYI